MSVPKLPVYFDMKYVEDTGYLSTSAKTYNDQSYQSLDIIVNYFNDGVAFPRKTTAEITDLEPNSFVGTVWYNTDLNKLQVKTATSTIETISSS